MTTTEQATEGHVFSTHVSLAINPATIDAAHVEHAFLSAGRPVVTLHVGGLHMQSYECDPLAVAAAFSRLSERIANAVLDARQSAETTP